MSQDKEEEQARREALAEEGEPDEEALEEDDEGEEEEEPPGPLRRLFEKHRKRLATLTLVLFLALVAHTLFRAIPREISLLLPLGEGHAAYTEARIEILAEEDLEELGEEESPPAVWTARLRFPDGAPASLRQRIDLSPGRYVVDLTLSGRGGRRSHLRGRLEAPAEGRVRVALRAPEEEGS